MVAKVEFPIGKRLFHLVVNPGTWRCPTVDLELVQTTRNVNGARHSVRNSNRENGPTFLDFPLFLGIFQWDEPTKGVPFTAGPEIPEILTKWKAPLDSTVWMILKCTCTGVPPRGWADRNELFLY